MTMLHLYRVEAAVSLLVLFLPPVLVCLRCSLADYKDSAMEKGLTFARAPSSGFRTGRYFSSMVGFSIFHSHSLSIVPVR